MSGHGVPCHQLRIVALAQPWLLMMPAAQLPSGQAVQRAEAPIPQHDAELLAVARDEPASVRTEAGVRADAIDVRAIGKCLALCLPTVDFREIIMTHPHVLEYIGDQADQHNKLEMT